MTTCPHCTNSDMSMIEMLLEVKDHKIYLCSVCGKKFYVKNGK